MVTIQLGRPSLSLENQLRLFKQSSVTPMSPSDELNIALSLQEIVHSLANKPGQHWDALESRIPPSLRVTAIEQGLSLSSATLYIALHPLLTDSTPFAFQQYPSKLPTALVQVIIDSASVIIDHVAHLNEQNKIISIWIAAEQILMAGTVWLAGLLHQRYHSGSSMEGVLMVGTSTGSPPVIKVTSLLASFAARWRGGYSHVAIWDAVLQSVYQMR
jgi:hypothetical protein